MEKKKRRAAAAPDLSVTIPSLFQCPISLDVMKSPVSLSTGITYDRSSIQTWLDAGHNTCPATMQVLDSTDWVPNHTLHRLIQIWSDSLHDAAMSNNHDSAVLTKEQACELVAEMRRDSTASSVGTSLEKLAYFGGESAENRRYLDRIDGFLDLVVDLIRNADCDLSEQALKIIPAIVSTEESEARRLNVLMLSRDSFVSNSLLKFLRSGSSEAKIAAAKVLEIIAGDSESMLVLAEKEGVIDQLMTNFFEQGTDPSLMEAVLFCLISLSMVKRVKVKLVRLGIVASIAKLLSSTNQSSSLSVICIEGMLKLLETVSSCKDGRTEICEDSTCIAAVLNKTMKVSKAATEHAVTILWIMCYLFRGEKATEAVARNNGLTKILLVMQSNCSAGVRQMAGDVLKMLRMNSKSCLWSYDNKMTHITSLFD